jgi:fatty acid desaturase
VSQAVSDIRALVRDEALTVPDTARSAAQLGVIVAVTVAAAVTAASTGAVAVWAVCWFAIAWFFVSCSVIVHETSHGHLFRSRRANRVVGNVIGAVVGIPWGTYRAFHLEHHRTTAGPDDPEGGPYVFPTRLHYLGLLPLGGPGFIVQLLLVTARGAAGRGPRWIRTATQRREVAASGVVQLFVVAALVAAFATRPDLAVRLWLIPYLFALLVLFPLVLYPEHAGGQASDDPLRNTRTVRTNAVLRFWYWNGNFHTEHHAVPAVTYRNLPRLAGAIGTAQEPAWRNRSYTEFHLQQLRALPLARRRPRPGD